MGRASLESGYFASHHEILHGLLDEAKELLKEIDFDTVVVRGISGTVFGSILSYTMRKNLLVVRKDAESNHGSFHSEGVLGSRWIFVDDFIGGGNTFKKTWTAVEKIRRGYWDKNNTPGETPWSHFHATEFVGAYLYEGSNWLSPSKFVKPDHHELLNMIRGAKTTLDKEIRDFKEMQEDMW